MSEVKNSELDNMLKAFPTIYQSVYGHSEYDDRAQRLCADRLPAIKKVYQTFSKAFGRPLRVLEFGCNFGFFSLSLAQTGGVVTGVDIDAPSVKVCKILAAENPDLKVEFICASIESVVEQLKPGQFDLVLGMSVFHHLCRAYGWEKVRDMIAEIAKKVPIGIFELALKSEAIFASALPDNYRELLAGFDYIKLLSANSWNSVKRPLCFASKKFIYIEDICLLPIDQVVYNGNRRYFYCGDKFVKYSVCRNENSYRRSIRELEFLKDMGGKNGLPKLYVADFDKEENLIYVIMIEDKLNGVPLFKKLDDLRRDKVNLWEVAKKILKWMVFLEEHDYYSFDVHCSNFIYCDDGNLILIDYELIFKGKTLNDAKSPFPRDYIMQFLFILSNLYKPEKYPNNFSRPLRLATFLKDMISQKQYEQLLAIRDNEKVFARMYEILFQYDDSPYYTLAEHEILAIEDHLEDIITEVARNKEILNRLTVNENVLFRILQDLHSRIERLEKIVTERQN